MDREDYHKVRELICKYDVHTMLAEMCNHLHAVIDCDVNVVERDHTELAALIIASNATRG